VNRFILGKKRLVVKILAWRNLLAPLLWLSLSFGGAWCDPSRGDLEIPNLGVVKEQIKAYHDSGLYDKEIKAVTDSAKQYLEENLARYQGQKAAIVFDIDETTLSNWPIILAQDFAFVYNERQAWVAKAEAPAIQGSLELYRLARDKGLAIIFLTGRGDSERTLTALNLKRAGYTTFTELIMMSPEQEKKLEVGEFKRLERKRLTAQGYRILINIGDQASDLAGGYAEATFKLPNPMYYVP